ncbi:hypothetical protein, partial [Peloplasma aerotolerans]
MKKLHILFVFLIILFLSSCDQTDADLSDDTVPSDNLIGLVTSYQAKLTSIIEEDEASNQLISAHQINLAFDEEDPFFNTRETFLVTYNTQRDNAQDVQLSPHLMIY